MNERIRMVREEFHLSRAAFGKDLGVSGDVINNLERGRVEAKDPIIKLICSTYQVSEKWLRTGEGKMFIQKSPGDEISAFVGDILRGEPDFRQRFITVLARMTPDEWKLLERKVLELADEIKKADPDGSAQQESSDM